MTNQEHISRLQEAQDLLREALDILKDVAREIDTDERDIIAPLEQLIDNDHFWLGKHDSIEDWIKRLQDDDEDFEEDEDTEDVEPEIVGNARLQSYIPPPTDPATFPHTPEFAAKLYAEYGRANQRISAIRDYRREYGVGLKVAKDAVYHIFDSKEGF